MKPKIIFILLSLLCIIIIIFCIVYKNKKIIDDYKSYYSSSAIIKKGSKIYSKDHNEYKNIGMVKQDLHLLLDEVEDFSKSKGYFKISNSEYYIYYKDCKENEFINDYKSYFNQYLLFNKNVVTKNRTVFYMNDNEIFNLNDGVNLPLLFQDSNYYYVKYFDNIFQIEKRSAVLVDSNNTEERGSEFISVIHLKNIVNDKCNTKKCISLNNVENLLNKLKLNNSYTINFEKYLDWLNGNIRLKEKAILIIVDNDVLVRELFDKYNFEYVTEENTKNLNFLDDNVSTKVESYKDNISSYLINEKNYNEIINYIINGENYTITQDFNSYENVAKNIAVLNYHFFYDKNNGESCGESICLEKNKFEEHLKYLKDNNYKTLTIDEFKDWMYGDIEVPEKSVLITIDDGAKGTGINNGNILIPLLEKYEINATLFLISGWWSTENYQSLYLDIQSHTSDMHNYMKCSDGSRKPQLLCSSYDEIMNDLSHSLNDLDSNTAFCFPFYMYNNTSLQAVKDSGFKIAFVGGGYKASRKNDKYLIPRFAIQSDVTINEFINFVN